MLVYCIFIMSGRTLKRVKVSYPCSVCKHTCDESLCVEPSVFCDCCDNWVHLSCEYISPEDLCYLDGDLPYTCSVCIRTADGPTYNFQNALYRLNQVIYWFCRRYIYNLHYNHVCLQAFSTHIHLGRINGNKLKLGTGTSGINMSNF